MGATCSFDTSTDSRPEQNNTNNNNNTKQEEDEQNNHNHNHHHQQQQQNHNQSSSHNSKPNGNGNENQNHNHQTQHHRIVSVQPRSQIGLVIGSSNNSDVDSNPTFPTLGSSSSSSPFIVPSSPNDLYNTYNIDPDQILIVKQNWALIQDIPIKQKKQHRQQPDNADEEGEGGEENEAVRTGTGTGTGGGGQSSQNSPHLPSARSGTYSPSPLPPDVELLDPIHAHSRMSFGSRLTLFYDTFYRNLFALCPALRILFKSNMRVQGRALAGMLSTIINLFSTNDIVNTREKLGTLVSTHKARGVTAAQYDVVGQLLIQTLKQVLNNEGEFGDKEEKAWLHLYTAMLNIMAETDPQLKKK